MPSDLIEWRHHAEAAEILRSMNGWEITLSRDEGCVIINTTDYHPPVLRLTEADLWELLGRVTGIE